MMQRYEPEDYEGCAAYCMAHDNGIYVLHSEAQVEIARLTKERDSAVSMESIGKSFHDLAVKERDLAQYQLTNAKTEIARLQAEVERAEQRGYAKAMEAERILYDQSLNIVWNDAIEAAAQLCDLLSNADFGGGELMRSAQRCSRAIRAMRREKVE